MKRKFVLLMMLFVLLLSSIANADGGEDASLLPNDIIFCKYYQERNGRLIK